MLLSHSLRALLGVATLVVAASAQIAPQFQQKLLDTKNANVPVPVLIVMREQLDVAALDDRLHRANATRSQRHQIVVEAAQGLADRSQAALLAKLAQLERRGHASDVRPFWIMNGVGCKATPAAIVELSFFPGVEQVEDGGGAFMLIEPIDNGPANGATTAATEPGLLDIKADFLWNLGFLGAGRLVSNIDTGVEITHPAYSSRWRGRQSGVTVAEAWHSPSLRAPMPADRNGHGTHTMGTMCGDDGTNRVGVAPMADWIASDAIFGSNITQIKLDAIDAFEWSADPDGDPTTVEDVPDVSSNSWGLSPLFSSHMARHCDPLFWQSIDVAEAAGVVVVFAAGNEGGRGAMSLRTPADRETPAGTTFSVGALNPGSQTIASFSSRGPSGCAGNAIKPEVCAQGANVRSSYRGGGYRSLSGTSMACPHVAGAAALLRNVDPNLSSRQVKDLLFDTAVDLGASGEDNIFGNGRIDLERAYNRLRAQQGRVSVGIVTTTNRATRGSDLVYSISAINNTNQPQSVVIQVDLIVVQWMSGGSAPIYGPAFGVFPAGFNVEPNWPSVSIPIPANLGSFFLQFDYKLRIRALDPMTNQVISEAETDFNIVS